MNATARKAVTDHMAAAAAKKAKEGKSDVLDRVAENVTPENITKWGLAVAEGIKAVCQSLNVEVNAFVKTSVGKLTMALIVYKVVGKDAIIGLKNMVFTIAGYLFTVGILLFSFYKLHIPRKKYTYEADDKGKMKRTPEFEWEYPGKKVITTGDMRVLSAAIHAILFVVVTVVAACAI